MHHQSVWIDNRECWWGKPQQAKFAEINWGNGAKYLQVEMLSTDGSGFTDMGTAQLLSVPYAIYSGTARQMESNTNNLKTNTTSGLSWNFRPYIMHGRKFGANPKL
jgi:hypothetical protein